MHITLLVALSALLLLATVSNAATADLDSAQSRLLADAEYYLKDVDRELPKVSEQARKLAAGELTLSANDIQKLQNQARGSRNKLTNALTRLAQLPDSDAKVLEVSKRAAKRAEELVATETALVAAAEQLTAAIAAFTPEEIEEARRRLFEFAAQIGDPSYLVNDPAYALPTAEDLPRFVEFANSVKERFAPILAQPEGRDLGAALTGFEYKLPSYLEGCERALATSPDLARGELDQAREIARIAVEKKRPQSFVDGAVQGPIERARVRVRLLSVLEGGASVAKKLEREIAGLERELGKVEKKLEGDIIAANEVPSDLYRGDDRDALLTAVDAAWKKSKNKHEVLAVHVPARGWERWTGWRWLSDGFYFRDESRIQVAIVTRATNEIAHVTYAHVTKDHAMQDVLKVTLDDRGEVPAYRKLLLEKLR